MKSKSLGITTHKSHTTNQREVSRQRQKKVQCQDRGAIQLLRVIKMQFTLSQGSKDTSPRPGLTVLPPSRTQT